MNTTIAVKEATLDRLKGIMRTHHTKSLDQTINSLIDAAEAPPSSMFGIDKRTPITLTKREHEEFEETGRDILLEPVDDLSDSAGALSKYATVEEVMNDLLQSRKKAFR